MVQIEIASYFDGLYASLAEMAEAVKEEEEEEKQEEEAVKKQMSVLV